VLKAVTAELVGSKITFGVEITDIYGRTSFTASSFSFIDSDVPILSYKLI
jgi:hypothetical protein